MRKVYLSKAAIFDIAAQGLKRKEVEVPQWGEGISVHVRELTAKEFEDVTVMMSGRSMDNAKDVQAVSQYIYDVVLWCTTDENGTPLFSKTDRKALTDRGRAASSSFYAGLVEIANAALSLSGVDMGGDEDKVPN